MEGAELQTLERTRDTMCALGFRPPPPQQPNLVTHG